MIIKINIQSMTDIITNSSSESFVIKAEETKQELEYILKNMFKRIYSDKKPRYSGMGGIIEVLTLEELAEETRKSYPANKQHLYTKEMKALEFPISLKAWDNAYYLTIDERFEEFIEEVLNTFECIYVVDSSKIVNNKVVRCKWDDPDAVYGWAYINDEGNAITLEYTDDDLKIK